MPNTACPACGTRRTVAPERLGHHVRCPYCQTQYTAKPVAASEITHSSHPAGLWLGWLLLAVAAALAVWVAVAVYAAGGQSYAGGVLYALYGAPVSLIAGGVLVARFYRHQQTNPGVK